ncbi:MAG: hypothetical protein RIS29_3299 [Bacteroidota bacterium]|jgi:FKBP-type peptidyl-prolyl cis-trans isomerase
MKKAALFSLILFLFSILYSCTEKETMDWKLLNDHFYATLEDTVAKYKTYKFPTKTLSGKDTTVYLPFTKTKSGIYYQIIKYDSLGRYASLNANDYIYLDYKGYLIDGTVFDSADSASFSMSGVIKGWQELMHKIPSGSQFRAYIPSSMAYDSITTEYEVPAYSVLKFDITILDSY